MKTKKITVRKLNLQQEETWRYSGVIKSRQTDQIILEARFNRDDLPFHGILIKQNDRFVETFYTDRWYSIFEIHDRDTDLVKGLYCNIGFPAVFSEQTISYIDLALDLLIYPDGKQLVLDEDEFTALPLPENIQNQARKTLLELQELFKKEKRI